jgi:transglutaminase-like putative cysteine protease
MRFAVDVIMDYQIRRDDVVLLMIEAAQTDGQAVLDATLDITDATLHRAQSAPLQVRVPGQSFHLHYRAVLHITRPDVVWDALAASPVNALPDDVAPYLHPSRYCPSDQFRDIAEHQFGALAGGAKIAAIARWITATIAYVPGSSNGETTAMDTYTARAGVCRDFTHVLCCMARAAGIPARYASVYGVAVDPPDFHAVAQVWLDGAWHLIDATGMSMASGLAIIAVGQDAGDVSFMETEHWAQMIGKTVTVTPQ